MKKKIVYATMLMSTIALLSTGFAAWIINVDSIETKDGTIAVDTVSNVSRIIGDFKWEGYSDTGSHTRLTDADGAAYSYSMPRFDGENPVICYGVSYDNATADGDFYNTGTSDKDSYNLFENLILSATFTVTNVSSADPFDKSVFDIVKLDLADETEGNSNFAEAQTKNYISATPEVDGDWSAFKKGDTSKENSEYGIKLEKVNNDESMSVNDSKFKITIKFGWGSAFDYLNPYDYYETHKADSGFSYNDLYNNLNEMHNVLDGVSFKLTIKTARSNVTSDN